MAMLLYRRVIFHTFFFFPVVALFSPTSTSSHIPDEPENLRILQARRVFQAIDEDHSGFISLEEWGATGEWREYKMELRSTLRYTNVAMEHGPFEDVFPIKNGDIPASYVSLLEGVPKTFRELMS